MLLFGIYYLKRRADAKKEEKGPKAAKADANAAT